MTQCPAEKQMSSASWGWTAQIYGSKRQWRRLRLLVSEANENCWVFSCGMSHCWQPDSPVWLPCWAGFWLGGVLSVSSLCNACSMVFMSILSSHTNPWFERRWIAGWKYFHPEKDMKRANLIVAFNVIQMFEGRVMMTVHSWQTSKILEGRFSERFCVPLSANVQR